MIRNIVLASATYSPAQRSRRGRRGMTLPRFAPYPLDGGAGGGFPRPSPCGSFWAAPGPRRSRRRAHSHQHRPSRQLLGAAGTSRTALFVGKKRPRASGAVANPRLCTLALPDFPFSQPPFIVPRATIMEGNFLRLAVLAHSAAPLSLLGRTKTAASSRGRFASPSSPARPLRAAPHLGCARRGGPRTFLWAACPRWRVGCRAVRLFSRCPGRRRGASRPDLFMAVSRWARVASRARRRRKLRAFSRARRPRLRLTCGACGGVASVATRLTLCVASRRSSRFASCGALTAAAGNSFDGSRPFVLNTAATSKRSTHLES